MLLVINGAPGVGKSTLARSYADTHPLSLVVDIDSIRLRLGAWAEYDESKSVARDLAVALVGEHLQRGHSVIVPQFIGRVEFLDRLRRVAAEYDVPFVEVVLTDDTNEIVRRFRARRAEYRRAGEMHPEADLGDDVIEVEVTQANERLLRDATARAALAISAAGGPEASCAALHRALAEPG